MEETLPNNNIELSKFEKDALGELGNMGAGAAGIALSKFLNRDVSMSLPKLKFVSNNSDTTFFSPDAYEQDQLALIRMSVILPFEMELICLINKRSFGLLLKKLFQDFVIKEDLSEYQSLHYSLIKEIGSILILQYITALNKLLNIECAVTYPTLHMGSLDDTLSQVNSKYLSRDDFDCTVESLNFGINLDIFTVKDNISFELIVLPCTGAIRKIIKYLTI